MADLGLEKWDIALARVKFAECDERKLRPIVVLDEDRYCLIGLYATTQGSGYHNDYPIKQWEKAGLRKQTFVRLGLEIEVDKAFVVKKIGRLQEIDIEAIEGELSAG